MKARKVIITLEVQTDVPLKTLRQKGIWIMTDPHVTFDVEQVQVNVARTGRPGKGK